MPDDALAPDWQTGSQLDPREDVRLNRTYEHIVLGVGGIGSAAAYWLARRGGKNVLAIEQYDLGHGRGASEDHSRIIRHAYHTADYASLTRAAYEHVRDLGRRPALTCCGSPAA